MKNIAIVIFGQIRTFNICYESLLLFIHMLKNHNYHIHIISIITYENTISNEKSPNDTIFFNNMYENAYIDHDKTVQLLTDICDHYHELKDDYEYDDVYQLQILRKYKVMTYIHNNILDLDVVLFTRTDAYYFDVHTLFNTINTNTSYFHFADALYCFDTNIIYNKHIFNDEIYNNLKKYDWFCKKVDIFYEMVDKNQINSRHYAMHYLMNYFIDCKKNTLDYIGVVIMCNNNETITNIYNNYLISQHRST